MLLLAYTLDTPTLSVGEIALRLGVAGILGFAIGFERERRDRAAGLRTHILVSVGAAAFTILSAYGWHDFYAEFDIPEGVPAPPHDPSRIAAQIVSGIGFLGGGVILRTGLNVKGLTTAASIWAMGAIGMAAGAGMFDLAVISMAILLFSLVFLRRINTALYDRYHRDAVRLTVRLTDDEVIKQVMRFIEEQSVEVGSIGIEGAGIDTDEELITVDVMLRADVAKLDVARKVARMRGVTEVHVKDSPDM